MKNFFSTGNAFLEVDIEKYKKTVIFGKNGEGKSTICNAITFGIFGKTIKKVTKGQIINSINGKNCVVEIEFSNSLSMYMIRRGIKPNIFEIYKDGTLIDQSSVGDYQSYLEENIIKCSYRTFIQTSIISIENYRPFMSLTTGERREFIEDILDIRVFTTMNQLVKSQVNKNKEELRLLEVTIKSIKDKIILQKSHIAQLEEMKQVGIDSLDAKLSAHIKELETVSKFFDSSHEDTEHLKRERQILNSLIKEKNSLSANMSDLRQQIIRSEKDIAFFKSNDTCLTCRQPLDENHVHSIIDGHQTANFDLRELGLGYVKELEAFSDLDTKLATLNKEESEHNSACSVANATVTRLNRMIGEVNKEKSKLTNIDDCDIQDQKISMGVNVTSALKLRDRQLELTESQTYNDIMLELFKDTGVKSKIVEQYVDVINTLVNQYLEKLDFFVSFTLDSTFVETIKSRHRDDFTYSSFSAGERLRIDAALLFTFRQLAKMRNSFASNLLLLDEIVDASADAAGVELLIDILQSKEFDDTNIMIISHGNKERFEEKFDGFYSVTKRDGFTQING